MPLVAILILPAVAGTLSLILARRQWAAPISIAASAAVLVLAASVAAAARDAPIAAFGGWLAIDGLGALVLVLAAFIAFTAALYSWGYIGHPIEHRSGLKLYWTLYNFFVLSLLAVPMLSDLALVWIAVELTTLLSAFLVGFEDTEPALEAAWKYVVLTSLGAIAALLGFLLFYWGIALAGGDAFTWAALAQSARHLPPSVVWPAFLLVLVGFGTKVGLAPMHTWLPDAHSQAPAPICALLSGIETTTALYVILRLVPVVGAVPGLDPGPWLIGFGLFSVAVAALLLIHARDIKRMFAFSTIEHMGIILVAAGLGADLGAAMQLTAHAIAKSFCFFAAGMAAVMAGTQEMSGLRGLARSAPGAAAALALGAFAIAGAPPFAVFVGEFLILKRAFAGGHYWVFGLLALFIIVAFGAMLRHVSQVVFGAGGERSLRAMPASCAAALTLAALPVIAIGVWLPAPLQELLHAAAAAIGGAG